MNGTEEELHFLSCIPAVLDAEKNNFNAKIKACLRKNVNQMANSLQFILVMENCSKNLFQIEGNFHPILSFGRKLLASGSDHLLATT